MADTRAENSRFGSAMGKPSASIATDAGSRQFFWRHSSFLAGASTSPRPMRTSRFPQQSEPAGVQAEADHDGYAVVDRPGGGAASDELRGQFVTTPFRRGCKIAAVGAHTAATVGWNGMVARLRRRDIDAARSLPRQFRLALEELGPTFVKLGQLLSARSDITPNSLQRELSELRDHAPAIPQAAVAEQVRISLGPSAMSLFATFEVAPMACASIGQVHRATLSDGRRVAVKVQRPGIRSEIETDLALLRKMSRVITWLSARARAYDLVRMVDEFATMLRAETNFTIEAGNIDAIYRTFVNDESVTVPTVIGELSSESLLVMDWIEGIPLSKSEQLDAAGADRPTLARLVVHAYAVMIFQSDRFQADPQPANLISRPDGGIGLVDFGEVGLVTADARASLMNLLTAFVAQNADGVAEAVLSVGRATRAVDRKALAVELETLLGGITNKSLKEVRLGAMLYDLLHLLRIRGILLPADLAVLLKTMIVCEATTSEIDPAFTMAGVFAGLMLAPTDESHND